MIDRIKKPKSTQVFTFDQGASFLETIIRLQENPSIIAIHGQPNSGKSLLCKKILAYLADKGRNGYTTYPDEVRSIPYDPSFYLFQDTPPHQRATRLITDHFKRGPDARVLIGPAGFLETLQPHTCQDISNGDYTIIIVNDRATKKPIY